MLPRSSIKSNLLLHASRRNRRQGHSEDEELRVDVYAVVVVLAQGDTVRRHEIIVALNANEWATTRCSATTYDGEQEVVVREVLVLYRRKRDRLPFTVDEL